MSEKCRYGRDSDIYYWDIKGYKHKYECPRDAEVDGFCIFHKEGYWTQNKESEERVRKAFTEEVEKEKNGEELLCIGFHLPGVKIEEVRGLVSFAYITFQWVDFSVVTFQEVANFGGATFQEGANFDSATFQHKANFSDATFQGGAYFSFAKFQGEANFGGATFQHKADYGRATFQGEANFNRATFKGPASFEDALFIIMDEEMEDFIRFRRVKFDSPEDIRFDNCNLSRVSFIHTDITRVKFRNISWPHTYMLCDEELFERKKSDLEPYKADRDLTIENVLTVYRMLRENYEYNVDYETAGKFFVGEMEARRRNASSHPDKIILWLYKTLTLYGQSYTRPLYSLLGLIALFTFLRALILFFQGMASITIMLDLILESFAVSLQLKGTEGIDVIQRILSLPLLALFGLALRRRFERRFRH